MQDELERLGTLKLLKGGSKYMSPYVSAPMSCDKFHKAYELKKFLLEKYRGAKLEQVYPGWVEKNECGHCYHLIHSVRLHLTAPNPQGACEAIASELRLVSGIGAVTEQQLRAKGISTIADLTGHHRWAMPARAILQQCAERDVQALAELVMRRLPLSHPLTLRLTDLVQRHEMLFFDLESLGFSKESPIILLGLAQATQGYLEIHQYLVRHDREEVPALVAALRQLQAGRAVVTYNGQAFDLKRLEERLRYYRLNTKLTLLNFDLLHYTRKRFRNALPDCRLETLERHVLGFERPIELPGMMVQSFYDAYLEHENIGPLIPIIERNMEDLKTLSILLSKLCSEDGQ